MLKNYLKEFLDSHTLDELTEKYGIKYSIFNTKKSHNLVIFSYSQIDSPKTEPIVRMSRGIVLEQDTWKIINFPFYRFFNFEEVIEERQEFNWDKAVSTSKVDGSLISYFWYDGSWYMATRSMIGGDNRITSGLYSFKDLFLKAILPYTEEEFQSELNENFCYTFELVSPYNQIVTPYSETKLYFIGVRNTVNFAETSFSEFYENYFSQRLKSVILVPQVIPLTDESGHFRGFDEMKKLSESVEATDEGFVVVDWSHRMEGNNSYPRVKVKNSAYVALHHLRSSIDGEDNGVSYGKILCLLYKNEQDEFLSVLPQYKETFNIVEKQWKLFLDYMHKITSEEKFKDFMKKSKTEEKSKYQKEFAIYIQKEKFSSIFFLMYNKGYNTWREVYEEQLNRKAADVIFKNLWNEIKDWK